MILKNPTSIRILMSNTYEARSVANVTYVAKVRITRAPFPHQGSSWDLVPAEPHHSWWSFFPFSFVCAECMRERERLKRMLVKLLLTGRHLELEPGSLHTVNNMCIPHLEDFLKNRSAVSENSRCYRKKYSKDGDWE